MKSILHTYEFGYTKYQCMYEPSLVSGGTWFIYLEGCEMSINLVGSDYKEILETVKEAKTVSKSLEGITVHLEAEDVTESPEFNLFIDSGSIRLTIVMTKDFAERLSSYV